MGKHGPCYHCGVTSTPLWRNGPPEKPVLCNACGSRWRTKGTLANYIPLHARADGDFEDNRVSRGMIASINKNKEVKLLKKKTTYELDKGVFPDNNQEYGKVYDEDTSNRSSSGSAISFSESCAQFESIDASELTGPHQPNMWDSIVPSKKRTCINRPKPSPPNPSPIEKLTKDLYAIMHKQRSSCFSGSSEDLIFESEKPMVSVEIGHGTVLIRHPSSVLHDEESEASSLSVENKSCSWNEVYSHSTNHSVYNERKSFSVPPPMTGISKNSTGKWMQEEQLKKDKLQQEMVHMLESPDSPLCNINLNDILNFEEFSCQLSNEEQQRLLKYLSPVDSTGLPDSLKNMFGSHQLKESISSFHQRLAEGVFDLSFDETKTEDCKTLKRLILLNLSTSKWVEHYHQLKICKNNNRKLDKAEESNAVESTNVVSLKRSRFTFTQKDPEAKATRSVKRMTAKDTNENKELMENDGSRFSPRRLFALPSDGSSFMLNSLSFVDESSDQDVLLDVPSSSSFAQAELLNPTINYEHQTKTSSCSRFHP